MKPFFVPAAVVLAALAFAAPSQARAQGAARVDATASHFAPFTPADVQFMSGMIYHHAQAVMMAGWAPTHEASPTLRALCERIVVGQTDEINLMQRWLRDRHLTVPDPKAVQMIMPGMDSSMMMPGMLTAEQLTELDKARGPDFDRLFLQFMIQHHRGAITMVNQLFGTGSGEEEVVFKFASDVYADQTTEIDRMQRMLATLLFGVHGQ